MDSQLQVIGKIYEVSENQTIDKKSGQITNHFLEVQIEQDRVFEDINKNKKKKRSMETVNVSLDHKELLESSIDKFIAIPYEVFSYFDKVARANMTHVVPVADDRYNVIDFQIFDIHPFEAVKKLTQQQASTQPQTPIRAKKDDK
ncbi:MAG: hypothetical protein U9N49_04605 [Campylobacterota bacterium]|nr:hypothetical protein [Campylobacterota bacterium]